MGGAGGSEGWLHPFCFLSVPFELGKKNIEVGLDRGWKDRGVAWGSSRASSLPPLRIFANAHFQMHRALAIDRPITDTPLWSVRQCGRAQLEGKGLL